MRSRAFHYGAFPLVFILTLFGIVVSYAQEVKPVPIEMALPQYPFKLRQANITGKVIVEFVVTTKGDVANAFAVRSIHRGFDTAAIAAVLRWKFKPGSNQGRVVNTRMHIPAIFKLDGVRGPQIFRALEEESQDKLSDEMPYHRPPRNLAIQSGAYPHDSLLNNERKAVLGGALISAKAKWLRFSGNQQQSETGDNGDARHRNIGARYFEKEGGLYHDVVSYKF